MRESHAHQQLGGSQPQSLRATHDKPQVLWGRAELVVRETGSPLSPSCLCTRTMPYRGVARVQLDNGKGTRHASKTTNKRSSL